MGFLERVPPQNLEAERSVLGGILLENQAMTNVMEILQDEDFYRDAHRKIYQAMVDLLPPDDRHTEAALMEATEHLTAALDGEIQAKLWPRDDSERAFAFGPLSFGAERLVAQHADVAAAHRAALGRLRQYLRGDSNVSIDDE